MANDKASDTIEAALNTVLDQLPDYQVGDQIIDWVLVAYAANPAPENEEEETGGSYPMLFTNGQMPDYRALGLMQMGMMYVTRGVQ